MKIELTKAEALVLHDLLHRISGKDEYYGRFTVYRGLYMQPLPYA